MIIHDIDFVLELCRHSLLQSCSESTIVIHSVDSVLESCGWLCTAIAQWVHYCYSRYRFCTRIVRVIL